MRLNPKEAEELLDSGLAALTGGNHTFRRNGVILDFDGAGRAAAIRPVVVKSSRLSRAQS